MSWIDRLFGKDWPLCAVAAHLAFWSASVALAVVSAAAFGGLASAGAVVLTIGSWLAAAAILGAAGLWSGRLYHGNLAFGFALLTGWPARFMGGFVCLGATSILLFGYALTQVHG